MIKLIHFFSRQKLFVNLMVVLILFAGFAVISEMNREAFPNVNFDMVTIRTIYPGASPDEVENLITIPVEKELREISNLDKVRAYNIENVSVVVVYIDPDASNKQKIIDDIKDAVDRVEDFPENAEKPVVEEIVLDKTPVVDLALTLKKDNIGVTGKDYTLLRQEAKKLEDLLYELGGVAEVERYGYRDREYLVEVNPRKMRHYRVGLNTLTSKLKTSNLDLPGGVLRLGKTEYLLRTKGQFKSVQDVEDTVILANVEGFATRLGQIAQVTDTYEEIDEYERFWGKNAIILKVWKKKSADTITVSDKVKKFLNEYKGNQNKNLQIQTFNDFSRFVRSRLSSLMINAGVGFTLLIFILFLLLGLRMSLIVSVSIPISFMIAFMGMGISNVTLNVISMFAMVMVLGMIVDFSIVVSENSYRYMESGMTRQEAIEKGAGEVVWPVTTTLLCITAAFAPLLFMTGIIGKFVWSIPMVIILSLAASWFASMFILPTHLGTFAKVQLAQTHGEPGQYGLFFRIQRWYRRFLHLNIRYRYISFAILIAVFVASIGLSRVLLDFILFPGGGGETISIEVEMPQGTRLQTTLKNMKELEKIAMRIPRDVTDSMQTRVGQGKSDFIDPAPAQGTHRGILIVNLTPVGERDVTDKEILRDLRKWVEEAKEKGSLDKDMSIKFDLDQGGPPVGMPVNVEIRGKDFATLEKISNEYMNYLDTLDGVYDISTDLEKGKEEFRFEVRERIAAQAGLSVLDVAQAIRTAFDGSVATTIFRGDEDIDVRVRFPESYRERLSSLRDVYIANRRGGLVPLSRVANYDQKPGYSIINRLNYKRVVQVKANVDTRKITSVAANQKLEQKFSDIDKRYPHYEINYGGEQEDTQESLANLAILFVFALFLIYIILATFFRSLILPGVVMSAIPFGMVGVVLALISHLEPLSFMSLLGVVSLAGVIVSNTLVLVQFINNFRKEGMELMDALLEAGAIRLRPVILTSATTVLSLLPTVYGIGGRDDFVAPLALAFGYGLIFATFITLVLIPVFYHIAEDYKRGFHKVMGKLGVPTRKELIEL